MKENTREMDWYLHSRLRFKFIVNAGVLTDLLYCITIQVTFTGSLLMWHTHLSKFLLAKSTFRNRTAPACCVACEGGYGRTPVDASWMPVTSMAPDYIGCLSQMSNNFLSTAEDSGGGAGAAVGGATTVPGPSRQNSGGDHAASLPPTPVGSQLSGSQICTPLDGQVTTCLLIDSFIQTLYRCVCFAAVMANKDIYSVSKKIPPTVF